MNKRTAARWAAIGATTALMAATSACQASGAGGAGSDASGADITRYQDALNTWYKGTYKEPAGPTVAAPKGKDIWLVSSGLGIEYGVRVANAAKQAAGDLGWNLHVFDAKF